MKRRRRNTLGSHFDMRLGAMDQGSYSYYSEEIPEYTEELPMPTQTGPSVKQAQGGGLEDTAAQGLCASSGICGSAANMAAQAAQKALGKPMKPISQQVMAGYANDKSPAGQAQYDAAKEYNAEVERQNLERQALIAQYMREMTGPPTAQDLALGDAARTEYAKLIEKYGEDTKYLTLQEAYDKYPQEVGGILQSLAKVIPGLQGKPKEVVWAQLPQVFKEMSLMDLQGAFPNSTWLNPNSPAQVGVASTSSLTPLIVVGAGLALGAVFLMSRRKQ